MGSLNSDGSKIVRQNDTYRNIGSAITVTSQDLPNDEGTPVLDHSSKPFLRGPDVNTTTVQYVTINQSSHRKITTTEDNTLIDRQTNHLAVSASGNPEIAAIPTRDYGNRHTGDRIVLGDASDDTVIERQLNTSVRPSGV